MKSEAKDRLEKIRGAIPEMQCLLGCTACCSHVPWSKVEWEQLPSETKARHTLHSMKCPFLDKSGCGCHKDRAVICRLYGVADGMPCPMGITPAKVLTSKEAGEIAKEYLKLF